MRIGVGEKIGSNCVVSKWDTHAHLRLENTEEIPQ